MNERIYDFTGNPFVDAGVWAISGLVKKKPDELDKNDLKSVLNETVKLYLTKKWSKNIYSIFPNNPITNPSVKNKEERYLEILNQLIDEITPLNNFGSCISCGRRDIIQRSGKDKIPLTGSKKMVNYFSYGADGADYCPACAFAIQFSPLVFYACVNLLMVHSNSEKLMKIWSQKAIKHIRKQISLGDYTGCFDEGYKNQKNALFHIIEMIQTVEERPDLKDKSISINFYYFTNYIQNPDLEIYHIPASVFNFLYLANGPGYDEDWMKIVRRGYVNIDIEKAKEEKEYRNKPNMVYNNLLDGRSIIGFFINRKKKIALGKWDLLECYLEEVRKMDEKRILAIKKVADELADYIKTANDMKTLGKLETASNYRNYRNLLRIIIKKRIENGAESPLFSFDDYVNNLFPEGSLTWRETQDLILFRIYEVLHDWIIQQGISEELVVEEEEMEAENV
jgi:CRISPR-associated protein Cst1